MTEIIRSEIETATKGYVVWGVVLPWETVWLKRKWAAQVLVASLAEGDTAQTLADLKEDGMVDWVQTTV